LFTLVEASQAVRMKPMTMLDFAGASCGNPSCRDPNCAELVLHSKCHPRSPTWASVDKGRSVLILSCCVCDKVVAEIAIRRAGQ